MRDLPGPADDLADPAHRLRVGRGDRDRAHVVQDVLGGDGGRPDPGLGEGQVLGHPRVEVVADHQHVEVLGDGVDGVRQRRVGRPRDDVRQRRRASRMSGACPPPAPSAWKAWIDRPRDRGDRRLHEAGLVEGVGVQRDLQAVLVGGAQGGVDGGGGRAPVLVHLVAAGAGQRLLGQAASALTVLPLPISSTFTGRGSSARCIVCRCQAPGVTVVALEPSRRPVPPPADGGDAGGQRLVQLRRREEVDVHVDAAGGEDLALAGDDVGRRADDQVRVHAVGDVGVAGAAERDDPAVPDADVGADDAPVVEHDRVGDDGVQGARRRRVSVPWAIDSRIDLPPPKTASSPPKVRSCSTSIHRSVSPRRTWSPAVGPYSAA